MMRGYDAHQGTFSYHQAIGQAFQEELLGPLAAALGDATEAGSLRLRAILTSSPGPISV